MPEDDDDEDFLTRGDKGVGSRSTGSTAAADDPDAVEGKRPQPTDVLIRRLRRVASALDRVASWYPDRLDLQAKWRARANTCLQAAGRLEDLEKEGHGNR